MKKITCFFLLSVLFVNGTPAQKIIKKYFDNKDSVYGFYSLIEPKLKQPNTLLVLLDGFGGNADNFFVETRIDEAAFENNILTLAVPIGRRLYADSSIVQLLNTAIGAALAEYTIAATKVVIGGFSSGGTIALRYAELCKENPADHPAIPRMVFTGDSPIDLAGLYRSSKRELEKNFTGWWLDEARMIIDVLYKKCGEPTGNKKAWEAINPFNGADTAIGNERFLAGIAYRTYHDIDVAWQLDNRGRSLYQVNALDASELVSRLKLRGHTEADFVQSKTPGIRNDGRRHPHSWNIIDAEELMKWIANTMK